MSVTGGHASYISTQASAQIPKRGGMGRVRLPTAHEALSAAPGTAAAGPADHRASASSSHLSRPPAPPARRPARARSRCLHWVKSWCLSQDAASMVRPRRRSRVLLTLPRHGPVTLEQRCGVEICHYLRPPSLGSSTARVAPKTSSLRLLEPLLNAMVAARKGRYSQSAACNRHRKQTLARRAPQPPLGRCNHFLRLFLNARSFLMCACV